MCEWLSSILVCLSYIPKECFPLGPNSLIHCFSPATLMVLLVHQFITMLLLVHWYGAGYLNAPVGRVSDQLSATTYIRTIIPQ